VKQFHCAVFWFVLGYASASGQEQTLDFSKIADDIVSDSVNPSLNKEFEVYLSLTPIELTSSQVDVRFYTGWGNLIMLRLFNGQWEVIEYVVTDRSRRTGSIKEIATYPLKPTKGFENFVSNLIDQNFTRLLNDYDFTAKFFNSLTREQKKNRLAATGAVHDGTVYTVEFKIGGKFRVYQFSNPEHKAKFHPEIKEYQNYLAIQKLFENGLVRK